MVRARAGTGTPWPRNKTREAIGPAGLEAGAGKAAARLSGGQRQPLCLALSGCGDPNVVILDELTVAMDAAHR